MLIRLLIVLNALGLGTTLATAQERVWNLDQTDQEAYLVFGVPETDDVGISFWCTLQSDIVKFYVPDTDPTLKIADDVAFELSISDKAYPLKGKTSVNEESGSTSIEAELKTTDSIFAALESTSHFSVQAGSSNHIFPLDEADFSGLLEVCKKP